MNSVRRQKISLGEIDFWEQGRAGLFNNMWVWRWVLLIVGGGGEFGGVVDGDSGGGGELHQISICMLELNDFFPVGFFSGIFVVFVGFCFGFW